MGLTQKGGVLTQKVKVLFGIAAVLAIGAIIFGAYAVSDDTDGATYDVEGLVTFCSTDSDADFNVTGDGKYYVVGELIDKDGNVSDTDTRTLSTATVGYSGSLCIDTPSTAGDYRLRTTFYTDSNKTEVVGVKYVPLKVVEPIKIAITLSNNSASDITMSVYLVINGEKVDDSLKSGITVSAATVSDGKTTPGTYSYTYNYVTDGVGDTTYCLKTDSEFVASQVSGLNVTYTFYAHDTDYTLITALVVIVLILLLVVMVYILRKPVVNKGKPKGRR